MWPTPVERPMREERRLSPRVAILGQLHGHSVTLDVPVTVREISLGGLSLETPFALPVGAVHEFELTLGDGAQVRMHGVVRRSLSAQSGAGSPVFVTGIEFIDDPPAAPAAGAGDIITSVR